MFYTETNKIQTLYVVHIDILSSQLCISAGQFVLLCRNLVKMPANLPIGFIHYTLLYRIGYATLIMFLRTNTLSFVSVAAIHAAMQQMKTTVKRRRWSLAVAHKHCSREDRLIGRWVSASESAARLLPPGTTAETIAENLSVLAWNDRLSVLPSVRRPAV